MKQHKANKVHKPHVWFKGAPVRTHGFMGGELLIVYCCASCGKRIVGEKPSYTERCK